MTIENFVDARHPERNLESLDNTFGYDDMLLTPPEGSSPYLSVHGEVDASAASGVNPSPGITEERARNFLRDGDRLFRLPNGGLLLRRSLFTDECSESQVGNDNVLPMSEDAARALAFFSRNMTGRAWCRPHYNGVEQGAMPDQVTPWDLSTREGLSRLQDALNRIQEAKDHPHADASATQSLGDRLAAALPQAELHRLQRMTQARLTSLQSAVDRWLDKGHWEQFKDIAFAAVIFTVVGHPVGAALSFLWNGFKGPDDRDGPGGGSSSGISWKGVGGWVQGRVGALVRRPSSAATPQTSRREALPDVVTGLLAYHHTTPAVPAAVLTPVAAPTFVPSASPLLVAPVGVGTSFVPRSFAAPRLVPVLP